MMFSCFLTLALLCPVVSLAQEATSSPDASLLRVWLNGSDPRKIAIAASLAGSRTDAVLLDVLPAILARHSIPQSGDGRQATEVVLDTVIQHHIPVPLHVLESIAESYPAQAAVLITRLPFAETVPTLLRWYGRGDANSTYLPVAAGHANGILLARVAVSILASDPKATLAAEPRGMADFVGNLVNASQLDLDVEIFYPNEVHGGMPGGTWSCSGYADADQAQVVEAGWPPVYAYRLQEVYSAPQPDAISIPGREGLIVRRIPEDLPGPGCFRIRPLDQYMRHQVIASLLDLKPREMAWQPVEMPGIAWTDQASYETQLGAITNSAFRRLRATTHALEQRGLLTHREAGVSTPRVVVRIICRVNPCPI
jgi:hypothetical protein